MSRPKGSRPAGRGPGGHGLTGHRPKGHRWSAAALIALVLTGASPAGTGPPAAVPPAWGWTAHEMLSDLAVDALPVALRGLYEPHREFVARHTLDPDLWRQEDVDRSALCELGRGAPALDGPESPRHFIDADAVDRWPFREIPRSFAAYRELAGDRLEVWGTAPWAIEAYTRLLAGAMRDADDLRTVLCHSANLAHYVQDLTQPLHLTENYNGQLTGQEGVHFRFESDLVDAYAVALRSRLQARGLQARRLDDPLAAAFQMVVSGYPEVDDVLRADLEALEAAPLDPGQEGADSPAYLRQLWSRADRMVLERLAHGAEMTASFWTAAWDAAGRPDLRELAQQDPAR